MGPVELLSNLKENLMNFDMNVIYYLLFLIMIGTFFMGNRLCQANKDYSEQKNMTEMFCENRDFVSLNAGVFFLSFAVFRSFKQKFNQKKEKYSKVKQ